MLAGRRWYERPPRTMSTWAWSPRRPTTPVVLEELRGAGALSAATRRRLARAAFAHTAAYDAAIVAWFDAGGPRPVGDLDGASDADRAEAELPSFCRPLCTSPSSAPRCSVTARTRTSRARATGWRAHRAGGTTWCSTAAARSPISTSSTEMRRGASCTNWRLTPGRAGRRSPSSARQSVRGGRGGRSRHGVHACPGV